MLNIELTAPLATFDIEATGIGTRTDRIVEICIIKLMPNKSQTTHTYRINPQIPIPAEVVAIHGITDADVANCPTFTEVADELLALLEGCDLAGYNLLRFDIPMLVEEFRRAGRSFDPDAVRVIDVQRIFHQREPRDLSAALKFYCGTEHSGAHGAEADVVATIQVLQGQLDRYEDLPRDIEELDKYCNQRDPSWVDRAGRLRWLNGEVAINFGRKKGVSLRELIQTDTGFIDWILRSEFPADVRDIIEAARVGNYPTAPTAPPA